MMEKVQEAIGNVDVNVSKMVMSCWVGFFMRSEILMEVRGYLQDGSYIVTYDVDEKRRLISNFLQPVLNSCLNCYVLRVLPWHGKLWHVDLILKDVPPDWELWAFGGKPLRGLQWDPGGLIWNDVSVGKQAPFF